MLKIYLYSLSVVIFFVLFTFARVIEIFAPYKKAGIRLKEDSFTDKIRTWVQLIFLMIFPVLNLLVWGYSAFLMPTYKLRDSIEDVIYNSLYDDESKKLYRHVRSEVHGSTYYDDIF